MSATNTPTSHLPPGTRVEALRNVVDNGRIFRAGQQGTIKQRWPYTVAVLPDGRKRTIETSDIGALKVI